MDTTPPDPQERREAEDGQGTEIGSGTTPEQAATESAEEVRAADPDPVVPPPPRATVVYNPIKVDLEVLRAAVDSAADAADWGPTRWLETTEDDPGLAMAREAVDHEADVVLVAGGDGTVRAAAEGLMGSGVPMVLLPGGTGNLLARNLRLPLGDLGAAVGAAFTGEDRAVDVGEARMRREDGSQEEHAFLVAAGLGLDAQMIEQTDDELKKRVGWLAYAQSIVRAARGGNRIRARVRLDDGEHHTRWLHTLLVGNCGVLPGNIVLLPDAVLDDGRFDIVVLRPQGPLGWVQIWSKVLVENGLLRRSEVGRRLQGATKPIRALRYETAARVEVGLREPEPIELDGDSYGEVTAVEVVMHAGSLTVRVPSTGRSAG